jgi:DNA invertase Pin-like site-specific DNA recombinase
LALGLGVTISRLSRQLIDFEVFRIVAAANDTLIYTDSRFVDPADSNDIIFSQIAAMMASFENRQRVRLMSQARITKSQARRRRFGIARRLGSWTRR